MSQPKKKLTQHKNQKNESDCIENDTIEIRTNNEAIESFQRKRGNNQK